MKLHGTVIKVRFYEPTRQYAVISVRTDQGETHTCVGTMPAPVEGMTVTGVATAVRDPKYGRQYRLSQVTIERPTPRDELLRYLASGVFPGVGRALAHRLVDAFGEDVFNVIAEQPDRLAQVKGLTEIKARELHGAFRAARPVHEVMLYLRRLGIGSQLARRVFDTLKRKHKDVAAAVRYNPYLLARVPGIGFLRADEAARRQGLAPNAPPRILAALLHVMAERSRQGHTQVDAHALVQETAKLIKIPATECPEYIDELGGARELVLESLPDGRRVAALPELHAAEKVLADGLAALARGRAVVAGPVAIDALVARAGLHFPPSQRQREAVAQALGHPVAILTGGPGVGKTTIAKLYLEQVDDAGLTSLLCAPTGRAAVRLTQATGRPAKTIHRALGLVGSLEDRERIGRMLEVDVVLCDEASMVGASLAARVVRAMRPGTRLLLIGDADQLPSVEAGNVLGDLIASGAIPTARLTEVYRHGEGSGIARAARDVLHGIMPSFTGDFAFVEIDRADDVADYIVHETLTRLRGAGRPDALQVLTPLRQRGPLASDALNRAIQYQLYRRQTGLEIAGRILHPGDKVLQTRNNYELDIYNGDIGEVLSVDRERRVAVVDFQGAHVTLTREALYDLDLAYAITIHKSQGGQFPVVILPVHSSNAFMLYRNLLYTGVTRAERELVLVGDRRGLELAIINRQHVERVTALARYIREAMAPYAPQHGVRVLSPFRR